MTGLRAWRVSHDVRRHFVPQKDGQYVIFG